MANSPLKLEMQDLEDLLEPHENEPPGSQHSTVTAIPTLETEDIQVERQTDSALPQSARSSVPSIRQYYLFDRIVAHNLNYLNIVCKLKILPFDVDVENCSIMARKSTTNWYWFCFIHFACVVKTLYLNVSLVASLLNPDWLQVLHLPIHLGIAIVANIILVYLFLQPKALRLSAVLLNEALAKRDRVKSFSRQQLISAMSPIGITTLSILITLGFPLLTTITFQFGTLLRVATTEWTSEYTMTPAAYGVLRAIAYVLDAVPTFWLANLATYMLMSHVLILEVLHSWCYDLKGKTTRLNLADCYQELVDMQITIELFNQIFGHVLFLMKAFCFITGIASFVTVFRFGFSGHLVMGAANVYMGITCLILYPLIYEKAALISGNMGETKKSLLMATAHLENDKDRAFWRRRVESIRVVYILCGSRPIERESLPLFYDFFWSNFISVLLAQ